MAISKRLRYEILRRDNHRCHYCGRGTDTVTLEVDHVVPVALGGTDDATNLVAACEDCNSGKTSVPADAELVADVDQTAARWQLAKQEALRRHREQQEHYDDQILEFGKLWDGVRKAFADLPHGWEESIRHLLEEGLDIEDLYDAAVIANTAPYAKHVAHRARFTYFMGVCRNKLRDIEEAARQILEDGDL